MQWDLLTISWYGSFKRLQLANKWTCFLHNQVRFHFYMTMGLLKCSNCLAKLSASSTCSLGDNFSRMEKVKESIGWNTSHVCLVGKTWLDMTQKRPKRGHVATPWSTVPRWVSFRISIGSGNKTVPWQLEAASLSDSERIYCKDMPDVQLQNGTSEHPNSIYWICFQWSKEAFI